jgi:hypothetical protein
VIRSDVVGHRGHAGFASTVSTTEKRALRLHPVTQDPTSAVIAHGRQLVDGALKAIEGMGLTGRDHLKAKVVIVAADFTASHGVLLGIGQRSAALQRSVAP